MDNNRWLNCCIVCGSRRQKGSNAMCLKWQSERERGRAEWINIRCCCSQKGVKQKYKWMDRESDAHTPEEGDDTDDGDNEIFHKFHIQLSSSMLRLIKFSLNLNLQNMWSASRSARTKGDGQRWHSSYKHIKICFIYAGSRHSEHKLCVFRLQGEFR